MTDLAAEAADENKMPAANLATMWAQQLMGDSLSAAIAEVFEDAEQATLRNENACLCVRLMISEPAFMFEEAADGDDDIDGVDDGADDDNAAGEQAVDKASSAAAAEEEPADAAADVPAADTKKAAKEAAKPKAKSKKKPTKKRKTASKKAKA